MPTAAEREEAAQMRRAASQMRAQAAHARSLTQGRHKIPVVLVNFSDKEFVVNNPKTAFSDMLNKEGYAANGGTGSVRDYYYPCRTEMRLLFSSKEKTGHRGCRIVGGLFHYHS